MKQFINNNAIIIAIIGAGALAFAVSLWALHLCN